MSHQHNLNQFNAAVRMEPFYLYPGAAPIQFPSYLTWNRTGVKIQQSLVGYYYMDSSSDEGYVRCIVDDYGNLQSIGW